MKKIKLYGLASSIACDLRRQPERIESLRVKYSQHEDGFNFEMALQLLGKLKQIGKLNDGRLYAQRSKVSPRELYAAALN